MDISNTTPAHDDIFDSSIEDDKIESGVDVCEVSKSMP